MIINSISLRNFKSYGNNLQKLSFPKEGSLILLTGPNGNGKCVHDSTSIDIDIDDIILSEEFIDFLETTELGNRIFIYIKENKSSLYEKIEKFRTNSKK